MISIVIYSLFNMARPVHTIFLLLTLYYLYDITNTQDFNDISNINGNVNVNGNSKENTFMKDQKDDIMKGKRGPKENLHKNVLFIMADDMRPSIGVSDLKLFITPHLFICIP